MRAVDALAARLAPMAWTDSGPRRTGDGYYECVVRIRKAIASRSRRDETVPLMLRCAVRRWRNAGCAGADPAGRRSRTAPSPGLAGGGRAARSTRRTSPAARSDRRGGHRRRGDHAHLRRARRRGALHRFPVAEVDGDARAHGARSRAPRAWRRHGHGHGLALRRPLGQRRRRFEQPRVARREADRQAHRDESEARGAGR